MSWVYFIRAARLGIVKIGRASCPERRLQQLATASAVPLTLVGAVAGGAADERWMHCRFASHHLHGEWFVERDDLAAYVSGVPTYVRPVADNIQSRARDFWNGWKPSEVAKELGLSKGYLSDIQHGKSRPSPETAIAIQRLTGLSAVDLVFGEMAEEALTAREAAILAKVAA